MSQPNTYGVTFMAGAMFELLKRLRGWDHLEGSADGPYWRHEIDNVLALVEIADTSHRIVAGPQEPQ